MCRLQPAVKQNGITDIDHLKLVSLDAVKFLTDMDLGTVENKYLDCLKVKNVRPVIEIRNTNCGLIVPAPAKFCKFINTCTMHIHGEL